VPTLCGNCHREGEKAARRQHSTQTHILQNYSMSIHGKGLLESGLVVTATCTSCHTAHRPLPSSDPQSTVNPANIPKTCAQCHEGIEKTFMASVHSPLVTKTDKPLPVCSSCHTAHTISRTDQDAFRANVMNTCGQCHQEVAATYFETYHGKVSKLGSAGVAKCFDCHGSHDILPVTDPRSHISRENIVATCAKCHPGSHRRFAGYLTHATHHDPVRYPMLFYTFWAMTGLLVGTFVFFGLHTLFWFPHSLREMRKGRKTAAAPGPMFERFPRVVRQLHFVLILSFFGLALTGMTLKFSYMSWAVSLSKVLGGFRAMGVIHRFCAVIMVALFLIHFGVIIHYKRSAGLTWRQILLGPFSLVPNWNDAREFVQTIKWFLQLGPRPQYGRWTYWEKFDYFAVFWGVAIIGATGTMLWFPEWFTYILPGWFINVATIIHSDEALLAVGFIFTIHFFNTHFRPEKFPMDMAMFTGRVSLEEIKHERPRYYEELKASGELEKHLVEEAPKQFRFWAAIFGTAALVVGFSLVLFIIYSMVFGYR
jgi:predicted CXXCH cytochrome family protein